jgi:hypothetical protein
MYQVETTTPGQYASKTLPPFGNIISEDNPRLELGKYN